MILVQKLQNSYKFQRRKPSATYVFKTQKRPLMIPFNAHVVFELIKRFTFVVVIVIRAVLTCVYRFHHIFVINSLFTFIKFELVEPIFHTIRSILNRFSFLM